jgi:hypothetical protein
MVDLAAARAKAAECYRRIDLGHDPIERRAGERAASGRPIIFKQPPRNDRTHYLYRHFDADWQLLYIGISINAFGRLARSIATTRLGPIASVM